MENKDNELLCILKKGKEDIKRELDGLDSIIQSAGQAISDKLTECNKTIEDGLAKIQAAKAAASAQTLPKSGYVKDVAKAAAKGILLAPLVWLGFVLGSILIYGLAYSIALGMGVCLKFLGL